MPRGASVMWKIHSTQRIAKNPIAGREDRDQPAVQPRRRRSAEINSPLRQPTCGRQRTNGAPEGSPEQEEAENHRLPHAPDETVGNRPTTVAPAVMQRTIAARNDTSVTPRSRVRPPPLRNRMRSGGRPRARPSGSSSPRPMKMCSARISSPTLHRAAISTMSRSSSTLRTGTTQGHQGVLGALGETEFFRPVDFRQKMAGQGHDVTRSFREGRKANRL